MSLLLLLIIMMLHFRSGGSFSQGASGLVKNGGKDNDAFLFNFPSVYGMVGLPQEIKKPFAHSKGQHLMLRDDEVRVQK